MSDSTKSASWKRAGYNNSAVPSLSLHKTKDAIDFWVKAFDATIVDQSVTAKGQLMHAEVRLGDTMVMVSETHPEMGCGEPSSLSLYLYVPDADVAYKRAVEAGVTEVTPVQEWFWGTTTHVHLSLYFPLFTINPCSRPLTHSLPSFF